MHEVLELVRFTVAPERREECLRLRPAAIAALRGAHPGCGCSPVAFRQRVSRARRQVEETIRASPAGERARDVPTAGKGAELERLVRLGEPHRATGRRASAPQALAAARRVAPGLLG